MTVPAASRSGRARRRPRHIHPQGDRPARRPDGLARGRSRRAVHAAGPGGRPVRTRELALPACSWLTWHPRLPVLYAVHELAEGAVCAVALGPDDTPRVLGTLPTGGAAPCHLAVTPDGRHLLAANYGSG